MSLKFLFSVTAALLTGVCAFASQDGVKNPFRMKVVLMAGFDEGSAKAASVKKFAAAYTDSHEKSFVFVSKVRAGADRFRVMDASGTVVYEGGDDREAETAVVNALTDMPVPGQLINGVELKKFRSLQKTFVMGKVKAEGAALSPFKQALKSKKPGEAEEAQAILDSIATAKKNLETWIEEGIENGDKGTLLRDIQWYVKTWPSEKDKYAVQLKKLSADPVAVKAAKELMSPQKKRR